MKTKKLFKEITVLLLAAEYEIVLESRNRQKVIGKTETLTLESDGVVLRGYPKEEKENEYGK